MNSSQKIALLNKHIWEGRCKQCKIGMPCLDLLTQDVCGHVPQDWFSLFENEIAAPVNRWSYSSAFREVHESNSGSFGVSVTHMKPVTCQLIYHW